MSGIESSGLFTGCVIVVLWFGECGESLLVDVGYVLEEFCHGCARMYID